MTTKLGTWGENALTRIPPGVLSYQGTPGRAYTIYKGDTAVGWMHFDGPNGWLVRVQGFEFTRDPPKAPRLIGDPPPLDKHFSSQLVARKAVADAFLMAARTR